MEKQQLIETLNALRAELAQETNVDPVTLQRLDQLTEDLQRSGNQPAATTPADVEPASSSLKDLLLKFEAEHPQLSASVGRAADALAAMGF